MSVDYSNLSNEDLLLLKRKAELEAQVSQEEPSEDQLTASEEILAYPAAMAKGVTLGLDKYIGGAAEAAKRLASGEDIGSPVSDYESMRNRLIEKGGVLPKTTELGASMYSPIGVPGKFAKALTPMAQSMVYGGTEGGVEGAQIGAGLATGLPIVGKVASKGGSAILSALSKTSEILGSDTKAIKSAVMSKTPLSTTQDRRLAQTALNKDIEKTSSEVLDKVAQEKFATGQLISETFKNLDKKVGRSIPATEITGYIREADKIANDWKGIPWKASESQSIYANKPGYTGIVSGRDSGKNINEVIDEVSGKKYFMPENMTKKAKFAEKLVTLTDNMNFPEGNKAYYQKEVIDLANKTDEEIQKEITRAMDGRVSQKSSAAVIDSIENAFYNKIDALNKKYIGNLTPSELKGFRDEIYDTVNYGSSVIKGKLGGQRIALDVSPKGTEAKMFEGELKQIGRKAKDTLEKYAEYHGIPLKEINERYRALSEIEEFLPDAIDIKNVSDPSVLSRAAMNKDAVIAKMRESGDNQIADYLEQSLEDIFNKQRDIAISSSTGGEINPFVRVPEQVIARAGNLFQRNVGTPLGQALDRAKAAIPPGSIIPYASSVIGGNSRTPQSIDEVKLMKLPRSTEALIESPELLMEKVKLTAPALIDPLKFAIEHEPQKIPDIAFAASKIAPNMFEDDKYGRFDGKLSPDMIESYIRDLRGDESISNSQKAKIMNGVLKNKRADYTPSSL